jgi:AICAR transformylase/IMP cyclohydrolase PurH
VGFAMLRSSAKNHASGTVVVNTSDYQSVIDEINTKINTLLHILPCYKKNNNSKKIKYIMFGNQQKKCIISK